MRRLPKLLLLTGTGLLVVLALLLTGLRLMLPHVDHWRNGLLLQVSGVIGMPVNSARLQGQWTNTGPVLEIHDLHIGLKQGGQLSAKRVRLALNIWQSLLHLRWQFQDISVSQLNIKTNTPVNLTSVADNTSDLNKTPLYPLLLHQFRRFHLHDGKISLLTDNQRRLNFTINQFIWLNSKQRHRAEGQITLNQQPGVLQLRLDLHDKAGMMDNGKIWLNADNLDITPWLRHWQPSLSARLHATGSLQAWLQLKQGKVAAGDIWLTRGRAGWRHHKQQHTLRFNNLRAHLSPLPAGWRIDIPQSQITLDNAPLPVSAFSAAWLFTPANNGSQWRIRASKLELHRLSPLMTLLQSGLPQVSKWWDRLQPQGQLDLLALDIPLATPQQTRFQLRARNLSWRHWHTIPGGEHMTGEISGSLAQGRLTLSLAQAKLINQQIFPRAVEIHQARGTLNWWRNAQGITFAGDNINIEAKSLHVNGDFRYQRPDSGQPLLTILAGIRLSDVRDAWRYYPHNLLSQSLTDYLTRAVQGGQVDNASLVFRGNPHQFPYSHREGTFQVWVPLHHGIVSFDPRWPALNDLDMAMDFINDGLFMRVDKLKTGVMQGRNLRLAIPRYSQAKLLIETELSGPAQGLSYFKQTPLRDSLADTLEEIQLTGAINAHLRLDIPLNHLPVQASGEVRLQNNKLYIKPLNYQLSGVTGKFSFHNGELLANQLQARWLDQGLTFSFSTRQNQHHWQVGVKLAGNWRPACSTGLPDMLCHKLQGSVPWQGDIAIRLPHKGKPHYHVRLTGDLKNLTSQLPAPLAKTSGFSLPFSLRAKGDLQQFTLKGNIGEKTGFNSQWLLQPGLKLEKASLISNSGKMPDLPGGNRVELHLPALNGDLWLGLLSSGMVNNLAVVDLSASQFILSTAELTFADQRWQQFSLSSQPVDNGRKIRLQARQINASIIQRQHAPWLVNIHYLDFSPQKNARNTAPAPLLSGKTPDFRHWPDIQLHCDDCWLWGKNYGRISAGINIHNHTLKLHNGLVDNGIARLTITGEWHNSPYDKQTRLQGSLRGKKLNSLTEFLALGAPVQDAPYSFNYQLNWNAAPWQPDRAGVNGQLQIRLDKGKISDVNTGQAGQLLQQLSVEALLRRLRFDFRDKFTDSFYFDSLTSDIHIHNGMLETDNTLIKGLVADVAIRGHVDLSGQRINLYAIVAPGISATVSVATALAINPVAGAAVYAASKIFSPLWSKISLLRYHISGSLGKPRVNEVFYPPRSVQDK